MKDLLWDSVGGFSQHTFNSCIASSWIGGFNAVYP